MVFKSTMRSASSDNKSILTINLFDLKNGESVLISQKTRTDNK